MTIAQIPTPWKESVIQVLKNCDSSSIEWKMRPSMDWDQYGFKYEAYELLIRTLSGPIVGQDNSAVMVGAEETWAFLCQHPLNPQTTLYAKIGLKKGHISILIFSMHTDLEHGKLEKAIQKFSNN